MYTVKQVAALTGISEYNLRAWERRYGVVQPKRSAGGYRLYSDTDVGRRRPSLLLSCGLVPSEVLAALRVSGSNCDMRKTLIVVLLAVLAASMTQCSPERSPTVPNASQSRPAPGGDVRLAAVGDMNPERNATRTSPSAKVAASITSELQQERVDGFLALGDFQYSIGRCADYVAYWNVLWGGTKSKLYWVSAPNHDWQPGRNEDLADFMNGECQGDPVKSAINAERGFIANGEPYAKDFGNWHVAFLSTALWRYDPDQADQVTEWLDKDLAAAQARGLHLAVVYHDPYFTSDTEAHSRATEQRPWIDVMYKYRVRITLSASQHNYERSCPVDNRDNCVADGMTAFQVSTGGVPLREFTSDPHFIAKRFSDTHGWLELTLRDDGSFGWDFHAVEGPGRDTGSRQ